LKGTDTLLLCFHSPARCDANVLSFLRFTGAPKSDEEYCAIIRFEITVDAETVFTPAAFNQPSFVMFIAVF